jgi:hypothetical protein
MGLTRDVSGSWEICKHHSVPVNTNKGTINTNAIVTHSRISNRVHTVSKPYRPGFTRIVTRVNS